MATCNISTLMQNGQPFAAVASNPFAIVLLQLLCEIQAAASSGTAATADQIQFYTTDPNLEAVVPGDITAGAIAVPSDGTGPWYVWGIAEARWLTSTMTFPASTTWFRAAPLWGYTELPWLETLRFLAVTCPGTAGGVSFIIEGLSFLKAVQFPNLTTVGELGVTGTYLWIDQNTLLESVSLPLLQFSWTGLVIANNGKLTEVSLPVYSQGGDFFVTDNPELLTVSAPLVTVVWTFSVYNNPKLTSINAPSLVLVQDALWCDRNDVLTSISFPALTSVFAPGGHTNDLNMADCPLLTDVSIPVLEMVDTQLVDFSGCALTAASVNHILARCVASAGFVSGTVDLSGGTNAAPTGQGVLDAATLTARGVTVTTN